MEILRSSISHSFSMVCIKNGTISYLVKCIEYFFFSEFSFVVLRSLNFKISSLLHWMTLQMFMPKLMQQALRRQFCLDHLLSLLFFPSSVFCLGYSQDHRNTKTFCKGERTCYIDNPFCFIVYFFSRSLQVVAISLSLCVCGFVCLSVFQAKYCYFND